MSGYHAPAWLPGAHLQTIYPFLFRRLPIPPLERARWETPDGDFVDVDWLPGRAGAPVVVLFHGLEGCSRSHYARALLRAARMRGWRAAVPHFRGCSGEPNRLPRAYHSGDTEEIGWALARVKSLAGGAPLRVAGVSLGGNAFAKWLGESGDAARAVVASAAIVSAPLDLMAAGEALGRGFGLLYSRHFLGTLRKTALAKLERYPGLFDAEAVRKARTLRAFDNVVTAPLHGFRDTDDYWTRASAKPHLPGIRVPTLLLNACDDPFLPREALPTEREVAAAVKLEFPPHGGHVGFVTAPFPGRIEWLSLRILHFLEHQR